MMEVLTRGEKGQGRFNKLILQQYFKDSDIMDKRCMLASMIRFLKPKQAYMMTDEEAFEELKKDPSNASFRYVGYLDDLQNFQRAIVRSYADLHSRDEMAGALLGGMLKGAGPLLQKLMLAEVLRLQIDRETGKREFRLNPNMVLLASNLMMRNHLLTHDVSYEQLIDR